MTVDILICTLNDGIYKTKNVLMDSHPAIKYIISHQVTNGNDYLKKCSFLHRDDVTYSPINCIGLAKNRNNALSLSTADLCVIADDDVVYKFNFIKDAIEQFNQNPELDVFIGKIQTLSGQPDYKNYGAKPKHLGWLNIGSVSSIEMVLKRESIHKNNILFDTNFGLGSGVYSKGEEAVLLSDCLKRGLKILYSPNYLVIHPFESSCSKIEYDEFETEYMGALSRRIFGRLWVLSMFGLSLKHYSRYKKNMTWLRFLKHFNIGRKQMDKVLKHL